MARHPDFSQKLAEGLESDLFSQAFYRLCAGLDDFDGLIAYGLYKDDKRKALVDRPLKRNDVSFHSIHNHLNDARCDILRENAHRRLKAYIDKVIERSKPSIQRDFIKTHIAERERWQFWKGVGASFMASLAMMLFLELAPWFAEQSPAYLANVIDQRLDKIEEAVLTRDPAFVVEPAAGPTLDLGDGHLLVEECKSSPDAAEAPICSQPR